MLGPLMNQARRSHGCAKASMNGIDNVISVGGIDENFNSLDSLETFKVKDNKWIRQSTKLPMPLFGLQAIRANSPQYLVYVTGGQNSNGYQPIIYGLRYNMRWILIGNLTIKRSFHASFNVRLKYIPGFSFLLLYLYFSSYNKD